MPKRLIDEVELFDLFLAKEKLAAIENISGDACFGYELYEIALNKIEHNIDCGKYEGCLNKYERLSYFIERVGRQLKENK